MATFTFLKATEAARLTAAAPTNPSDDNAEGITYAQRGVVTQLALKERGAVPPAGAVDLKVYGLFKHNLAPYGEWYYLTEFSAVDMSKCPRFLTMPEGLVGFEKLYVQSEAPVGEDIVYFFVTEPKVHH